MEKNKLGFITKFLSDTVSDFYMEMRGRRDLTVGGCRGICEYSEQRIRLLLFSGMLTVTGEGLLCDSYMNGAVVISGNIRCIELTEGAENGSV